MSQCTKRMFLFSICLPLALTGCGGGSAEGLPELATVKGKVLLDGQPLPEASVFFEPTESGALSSGMTDAAGEYELFYNPDVAGAAIGTHTIRVSKPDGEAGPELVPPIYNEMSQLKKDVAAGENTIDIELTSKG